MLAGCVKDALDGIETRLTLRQNRHCGSDEKALLKSTGSGRAFVRSEGLRIGCTFGIHNDSTTAG
jgi:hypothetical protein